MTLGVYLAALMWAAGAVGLGLWLSSRQDIRLLEFLKVERRQGGVDKASTLTSRLPLIAGASGCLWISGGFLPGPLRLIMAAVSAGAVSTWLFNAYRLRRRASDMKSEWPILLETMAVGALAGLDLNAAFLSSVKRATGTLRVEVDKAAGRVAGGTQLNKALLAMARDGVPGADRLRSLLLRCEVLGTPVAEVLESLAVEAATVERQELEGRFNALPLQLSVVTVLFLLPPVLILSIAPHVLMFLNSRW